MAIITAPCIIEENAYSLPRVSPRKGSLMTKSHHCDRWLEKPSNHSMEKLVTRALFKFGPLSGERQKTAFPFVHICRILIELNRI